MSTKRYNNRAAYEHSMESLIQKEIRLIYEYKSTRPRFKRKKERLFRKILKTNKTRYIVEHKRNKNDGILDSQLNIS